MFSILHLDWRISRWNDVSSQYPRCPNHLVENGAKMVEKGTFLIAAPRVLEWGVISPAGIVAQTQNYKRMWAFMKFPPTSRSSKYCGPFYRRLASDPLKVGILLDLSPKNTPLPKKLRCFYGCKIQCRLWFCHQNWSNFMVSPSYGRLKLRC